MNRPYGDAHVMRAPSIGDVLITRDGGWYAIAIVPDRQQLHLSDGDHAVRIALAWAKMNGVHVWRLEDAGLVKLDDKAGSHASD